MILGIGADIVHISRFNSWLGNRALMDRFFQACEVEYALSQGPRGPASLAGRFAAKEAFGKALGTGMQGLILKDIWIESESTGNPVLQVRGTALNALEARGGKKIHVSLSHDGNSAVAFVILEGGTQ